MALEPRGGLDGFSLKAARFPRPPFEVVAEDHGVEVLEDLLAVCGGVGHNLVKNDFWLHLGAEDESMSQHPDMDQGVGNDVPRDIQYLHLEIALSDLLDAIERRLPPGSVRVEARVDLNGGRCRGSLV